MFRYFALRVGTPICPRLQAGSLAAPTLSPGMPISASAVDDRFGTGQHLCVRHLGYRSRKVRPMLLDFNRRRDVIELNNKLKEENPIDRRSSFIEWNYSSELFAFSARLSENIPPELLKEAFTTEGFIEQEEQKQEELNIEGVSLNLTSNQSLSERGAKVAERVVVSWLRGAFPALPEEGVQAVTQFLLSEDVLADISFHIGTKDLILSVEYPPLKSDFVQALQAVIGAIDTGDSDRASRFVREIVIAQLVGKDINEVWNVSNPMRVLSTVLANQKRGEPEPRLLWKIGPGTLLSSFTVGIYSDKKLIGESSGESLQIAEEMAARDALRVLFNTTNCMHPLPLHTDYKEAKPNPTIQEWSGDNLPNLITA